jgi:hypothetical protein
MSTGPHPVVKTPLHGATPTSNGLALAPPPDDAAPTALDDLREVREGAVSLARLWGRLSGGSKAAVGGALVTLLGPLALTVYTQGLAVWGTPDRVGRLEGRMERVESMLEGLTVAAGLPLPPPASAPTSQP